MALALASYRNFLKTLRARIELRVAIKTGITAGLGWLVGMGTSHFFNRPDALVSGLWTAVTAVIVLQAYLGGTYQAAWVRFLGVLIGSALGGFYTIVLGSNPLTLAISVFLTVIICAILNIRDSVRIACMSVTVVIVLWEFRPSLSPWIFAFFRVLDSIFGICVAIFVANVLWPFQAIDKLRNNAALILSEVYQMYALLMKKEISPEFFAKEWKHMTEEVNALREENQEILRDAEMELITDPTRLEDWKDLQEHLIRVLGAMRALKRVRDRPWTMIDAVLFKQLEDVNVAIERGIKRLSRELMLGKFEEHLDALSEARSKLREELLRFRNTPEQQFSLQEVESFFVFFYSLNRLIDQLQKISKKLQVLFK